MTSPAATLILGEGVTNYLTAEAVDGAFDAIATLTAAGSPVFFTYVDKRMLDGTRDFVGADESSRDVAKVGEPYTFGLDPSSVDHFLARRGFRLCWAHSVADVASRYGVSLRG